MTTPHPHGPLVPAAGRDTVPAVDNELSEAAAARIADSWAANTRTAYSRDWTAFRTWCDAHDRSALPASAATLATYVDALTRTVPPPAPATVDRALGTIQSHHTAVGLPLDTKPARMVLRSYRRERAQAGHTPRRAPALTVDQLRAMVDATGDDLVGLRDRTLCLLGFAMMARRSELAALDIDDVREVAEGLEVRVRTSKTDRDSVGAGVAVPYGSLARTCPVRTTLAWIAALAETGITTGPLLRAVDRHGRPAGTPGATVRGSGRMSGAGINHVVKTLAQRAGIDAPVTAHSLRAGAATAAAAARVPRAHIARQGRWSLRSPVVDTYIRPADAWNDNPIRHVGL
ncbi:tyrosine-type recombinase/integrase [Thermobifida halotolerans]|uniref:Tyrosine-type recombinase/integrase n=1 Tax=Thermobifida halotolerans TaxID=483545 RepID=A0AA97M5D6_9ACTN|nr:tyrosine-type recombinase/integrase [Thermobifida halotolerans]UOE21026.1 tyrosine-type recombinase/integrase [Thermobifida halotolerans]